jgi:hypothetical protein
MIQRTCIKGTALNNYNQKATTMRSRPTAKMFPHEPDTLVIWSAGKYIFVNIRDWPDLQCQINNVIAAYLLSRIIESESEEDQDDHRDP